MKDECRLCGRVLSLYSLRRCTRCRKLYCRSCMTKNLWSEERDLICLNCARRIVAPRIHSSKFAPLKKYLTYRGRYTTSVTLSFSKIEGIIKDNLPINAIRSGEYWKNNPAWTSSGWKASNIDLKERTVTFNRDTLISSPKRKRKRTKENEKTFTPVPVKPRLIRKPSKTRIAQVVARSKNIEGRRATTTLKTTRVKLKPISAFEKRHYDPKAKPTVQEYTNSSKYKSGLWKHRKKRRNE